MSRLVSHLRRWLIGILAASSLFVVWSTWLALSVSSRENKIEVMVGLLRSLSSRKILWREADSYPAAPDQWTALQAGYRQATGAMARDNDTYRAIQDFLPAGDAVVARVVALAPASAADPRQALLVHGQLAEAQASLEKAADVVRARQAAISLALSGQWRQMIWLVMISCMIAAVLAVLWWRYQQVVVFRMRVQEDLEKSEEQFRALFEDAPVAYHELDTEGIVRRLHPAQCQQAEKDLRESASLLAATLEATAEGILVVDPQGKIVSHNQRFLDLWRIPPALAVVREDSTLLAFVESQLMDPASFRRAVAETYANPDRKSTRLNSSHLGI